MRKVVLTPADQWTGGGEDPAVEDGALPHSYMWLLS